MQFRIGQVMGLEERDTDGRRHDRRLSLDRGVWGHLLLYAGISSG